MYDVLFCNVMITIGETPGYGGVDWLDKIVGGVWGGSQVVVEVLN